jgi:hypothetical protein
MVFQAIASKFSCATFQKPLNTSHFVTPFLAHEDVVVGFVIFHTKLSTPWLACFICSSLILQGSWSDHYNKKKGEKEKGTPPWYVKVGGHPMESVSHGLWKEKWGGVPNYKEHINASNNNSESLSTCLVWKIGRTPLLVVDRNNHLSKQFFISVLQMKSSSTCLISASLCEGPIFYFYVELVNLFLSISSKHLSCYDSTIHMLIYSIMFSIFLCLVRCFYPNEYIFESYQWP